MTCYHSSITLVCFTYVIIYINVVTAFQTRYDRNPVNLRYHKKIRRNIVVFPLLSLKKYFRPDIHNTICRLQQQQHEQQIIPHGLDTTSTLDFITSLAKKATSYKLKIRRTSSIIMSSGNRNTDDDENIKINPDHEDTIQDNVRLFSFPDYGSTMKTNSLNPNRDATNEKRGISSKIVSDDSLEHNIKPNRVEDTIGKKILNLAIPAGAALLIDPLMNVVDTIFVGRYYIPPLSSTVIALEANDVTTNTIFTTATTSTVASAPLAGIGSSSAILTFIFYLCNFLCTATTPLIAQQRSSGNITNAIKISGQAITLSLLLGIGIMIMIGYFGPFILYNIMGTYRTGIEANNYAIQFLSIRLIAAPAILCIEAATGTLRGFLDTKTPVYVLIFANLINFILDVVFIVQLNMGPTGAAIATDAAEWISAIIFLGILAGYLPSAADDAEIGKNQRKSMDYPPVSKGTETESILTNHGKESSFISIVPLASIPSWDDIKPLLIASSSILFRSLMLQLSLAGAAAIAARGGDGGGSNASLSASAVAAHQIGIQLWLLCSFFCDSLAAASQGLIADAIGRNNVYDIRIISKTVLLYSTYLGFGLAIVLQIGLSTNWLLELFTRDASTKQTLACILPIIIIAQPLNAIVFAMDGIIQGASQFSFQAKAMALSVMIAAATFVLLQTINDSTAITNGTLVHVWIALCTLQVMRGITSLWKLLERTGPINLLDT